tara:strand:+ start:208 stop:1008 length:801 start_codon:yes stop_codon:yes gene_type:complete
MTSIKRNTKGEFQEATGLRTRKSSIYSPGQNELFKISRSKFSNFMDCKRCFYLDRVKGLQEPSMPGWALNTAVDELLKKEFDYYRERKEPHPIFKKYNLNFIPYAHEDMDKWRNSLSGGISYQDENTNLILHGGIDDVWFNLDTKELVVTDYKAQSTKIEVNKEYYLASQYHQGYKMQMDIYVHILRKMGFTVSDTTYFMVCNGEKTPERFDAKMDFTITLVDYEANTNWIEDKITEMKETLESKEMPKRNPYCENCAYLEQGAKL